MERIRERLLKGSTLNFVALGFNQGSTLIVNIIIARLLLKQSFGEFAMVYSTLLTFSTVSQLATGYTASKYIAKYRTIEPLRAGRTMGLCSIASVFLAALGSLLLIVFAPLLTEAILKAPHLKSSLMIGTGFVFFSVINGYQSGVLNGLEAYSAQAKCGIFSGINAMVIVSAGAWSFGLYGAIGGLSVSSLIRCAIQNRWLKLEMRLQRISPIYKGSFNREKSIIFKFGLPAAIAGCYMMPMIWLANSFLVRQPGGYGEMALFSAANNLRIIVLFLPNVINIVGLSVLNNEKAKGNILHYHRLFKTIVMYIFLSALGGAIIVGVFGRQILQLFGKDYGGGKNLLWILLASSISESLSIALYQYIHSNSKLWLSFFCIKVPREAILVTAAFYLVQIYGGIGLAWAYFGSTLIGLILHFSLVTVLYQKESQSVFA